jgi:hypothetical protein
MKSFNKNSNSILFLYPCYQYFFYERLYNFKKLNNFFEQIINITNTKIFIKFHPRHFNLNDQIFDFIRENNIEYSIENDLLEHINNFDTVVAFEPSGALVDSIIFNKKVVYINDYINIYENEKLLKKFISTINSLSFSQFLLRINSPNVSFKVLVGRDLDYFYHNRSINYTQILTKILNEYI